ncbi:hypothetical protein [Staphylococcus equorum]|uniref:hypothetical protein n=1 Tax=Staphylococcus equorum TaxID=246432 RepID=UPI0021C225CC|nr:hypothetical protein [Staphylococcus equorum]
MSYKEKVLESIRHLYLNEKQIIAIAGVLPTVTNLERETFEKALDYAGNIYVPFRGRLFLNYIYAIRAVDTNGVTMADYLLTHNGFSEKRPSSFTI